VSSPDAAARDDTHADREKPVDDTTSTHHTLHTADGELAYTATAGRVVLREEVHTDGAFDGHVPKAELFVVSYVRDDAPVDRPVTFAFNGGPGSSSAWLHLGVLGPRRVVMGDAGDLLPPPYGIADNLETLLTHSDLVFIDPVSTGYSRITEGGKPEEFHGFQRDIEAVGEMIRLWTTRHRRWLSPKYVAGESYGTVRASALAAHLQRRYGLFLNGVALISSVLDFGTIRFTEGNDVVHALYLPTYACLAHYHGLLGDRSLDEVRAEAEELATRDYPYALARGSRMSVVERADIVRRIAGVTGLSPDYVDRADLRIEHKRFFRELLRDRGQVIGRLDGRFTGWESDDVGEQTSHDPSEVAIRGPYSAAMNHYANAELDYHNELPYELLTGRVQPWSYHEFEGRHVSVAGQLSEAMRHNPHLRIYVACGRYDGATPYFAAEHALAHVALPDELRDNVAFHYYDAGHMMYVHEPSRLRQSADLAEFVTATETRHG
jgi:carboxypeptidase C (cathepsin A)